MKALVVISARAASTRLPMKPLRMIAGKTLLQRTIASARKGIEAADDVELVVATDHPAIAEHARAAGCAAVMTSEQLSSGSSRALAAAELLGNHAEIIVNFQGDAPFQPPESLPAVISALRGSNDRVATPVILLDWPALDALREHKRASPTTGTTCARAADGRALWFSKSILPTIRDERAARAASILSPVWRHIGLYAYRVEALRAFSAAPQSALEHLEGLEQLRLLELGISIRAVPIAACKFDLPGIDTEEDILRAESMIAAQGDPHELL